MYEKEIELLSALCAEQGNPPWLLCVLDVLRRLQPKDEAAEKRLCADVAAACFYGDPLDGHGARAVAEARASARAEVLATVKPCRECGQRVIDPHGDLHRSVCQRCEHGAAQPKDEAAEREHCTQCAVEAYTTQPPGLFQRFADVLLRERAAARAEGYAAGEQHQITINDSLRGQLADLRAEQEQKLRRAQAGHNARLKALSRDLELLRTAARGVVGSDAWDDVLELPEALVQVLDALQAALDGTPQPAPESAEAKLAALRAALQEAGDLLARGFAGAARTVISNALEPVEP